MRHKGGLPRHKDGTVVVILCTRVALHSHATTEPRLAHCTQATFGPKEPHFQDAEYQKSDSTEKNAN